MPITKALEMPGSSRLPNRWLIAGHCTLLQLCLGTVYAWSFFQPLLVETYQWSNARTSLAFSLTIFSLGVSAMWGGMNLPRLGPRRLAVAGGILFATGYGLAALALQFRLLPLFYFGYGAVAGAGIGLGYVTPMSTVTKWFPDRKGLLTGLVAMGFGLGAFVMSMFLAPFLLRLFGGNLVTVFGFLGVILGGTAVVSASFLRNPPVGYLPEGYTPTPSKAPSQALSLRGCEEELAILPLRQILFSGQFLMMWTVFFFNISAGLSIISFQSPMFQEIWKQHDPSTDRPTLAAYGAALIAVSSLFNGFGRIFWGGVSDRMGRVENFRLLLATQMVVFGILMTERNPWAFSALVCYVLSCLGGGFAIMPGFVMEVFGEKRMSAVYGAILTAWSLAGIVGPSLVAAIKDTYPDRAMIYSFLMGILFLGVGYIFSFLVGDDRFVPRAVILQSIRRKCS